MAQATTNEMDPPGRVGRISYVSGPVQLMDVQSEQSDPATLNWPITSGFRLSTGALGRAEVQIGSLTVRLDDNTEIDFTRIDDGAIQMTALHGSVALTARNRDMLRELDLLTPRDRIVVEDVGRYRIDVDRTPGLTSVTAYAGQARILSGRLIFTVASGQRGDLEAAPVTGFRLGTPAPDPFDDWVASRDRYDAAPRSAQYVSPEMTGMESLDQYGTWQPVETYGPVWFPSYVPAGWVPYRFGHWEYILPWGWTWIDDAPWGFAPFHYGRWVVINGAWGWYPGAFVARPVFAPALVAWFGTPGISVSIGIGATVGWFPLGPHEVFVPSYPCTRHYVNVVNVAQVTNITNITVINPPPHYINRDHDRTTWAPGSAFFNRGPIQRVVVPPPSNWRNEVTSPRPPVEPPRDIKKRPTPIPMPGREIRERPAPRTGQPTPPGRDIRERPAPRIVQPAPPSVEPRPRPTAPTLPAQPSPRPDETRQRPARPERPEERRARPSAPSVSAPSAPTAPSTPATPRATPPQPRPHVAPPSEESPARERRPIPAPQLRTPAPEAGARAPERERVPVRPAPHPVAPTAPPTAHPPSPPSPQVNPARAREERPAPERQRGQPDNRGDRAERGPREPGKPGPRD
ncbi:MAG: DUF6600 domain-containing protein [Gemmatimonadota bacterium]